MMSDPVDVDRVLAELRGLYTYWRQFQEGASLGEGPEIEYALLHQIIAAIEQLQAENCNLRGKLEILMNGRLRHG